MAADAVEAVGRFSRFYQRSKVPKGTWQTNHIPNKVHAYPTKEHVALQVLFNTSEEKVDMRAGRESGICL